MSISLPRRLLSHPTLSGETSATVQHASVNSATKLWLDLNWSMHRQCGTTPSGATRNTTKVEAVQRSSARFTCHDYRRTSSVTAMLQKLHWDSLQQRRTTSPLSSNDAVPYLQWTGCHSCLNLSLANCGPHQRIRNQLQTDPVQHKHGQSNFLSQCNQTMEHLAS